MFFRKTSRLILFLGLWMVGGFQIIQGETEIIPPKVQYFVDTSSQLTVEEIDKYEKCAKLVDCKLLICCG